MNYTTTVDAYKPAQLPGLFRLFGTYFREGDRLLSPVYSEWLYGSNPFGRARMISVREGGEWVAFLAFIPTIFERAGVRMPAYYAVNALVDPAHQGHSLFARMIRAGREHIAGEGAVLVGHPNIQAIKTWQRAKVHFQETLRPALAIPLLRAKGWRARRISSPAELDQLAPVLARNAASRQHWKVAASPEFLRWRYFDQPANAYRVQVLERGGEPGGVQIVRRMRAGLHLMMDQFVPDEHLASAVSLLPPACVCFLPESAWADVRGVALRVRVKKELPYFYTATPPVAAADVWHFNLTASDF